MKSKLFTPSSRTPRDCFVAPPTAPEVTRGFADAEGGDAMYPLSLDGSGAGNEKFAPPMNGGAKNTCYDDQE